MFFLKLKSVWLIFSEIFLLPLSSLLYIHYTYIGMLDTVPQASVNFSSLLFLFCSSEYIIPLPWWWWAHHYVRLLLYHITDVDFLSKFLTSVIVHFMSRMLHWVSFLFNIFCLFSNFLSLVICYHTVLFFLGMIFFSALNIFRIAYLNSLPGKSNTTTCSEIIV